MENDVSFRVQLTRLPGRQALMLQADAIMKLFQQFWGTGKRIGGEAFIGMIVVTGQDAPDESTV